MNAGRFLEVAGNVGRNLLSPPLVVLLYHRVARLAEDPCELAVAPENFRAQMKFLADHYPVLRFEDDWGVIEELSFVVTFDDGYADNLEQALPILEECRVPATFFVSSGFFGEKRFFPWDREVVENRILTEDELKTLAASELVTIGGHTVNHPRLSTLEPELQRNEIIGGCRDLERMLGRRIEVFAYPFGNRADFDEDSCRICREAGLKKAAAAYPGQFHAKWTDPVKIPRHVVRDWRVDEFRRMFLRFKYL